jgi:hypothetical protein
MPTANGDGYGDGALLQEAAWGRPSYYKREDSGDHDLAKFEESAKAAPAQKDARRLPVESSSKPPGEPGMESHTSAIDSRRLMIDQRNCISFPFGRIVDM